MNVLLYFRIFCFLGSGICAVVCLRLRSPPMALVCVAMMLISAAQVFS